MKRKITALLTAILLMGAVVLPTYAAAPEVRRETKVIQTEQYGEVVVETVLVVYDSPLRSSTRSAEKIEFYKADDTVIAIISLKTTFGYDNSYAWVVSASCPTKDTYEGWSYSGEKISKAGGTSSLSAKLTKFLHPYAPVDIKITCTADGSIS